MGVAVKGSPHNSQVSVGTTPVKLVSARAGRNYFIITNKSAKGIRIGSQADVTSTKGHYIAGGQTPPDFFAEGFSLGEYWAVLDSAETGTATIDIMENY